MATHDGELLHEGTARLRAAGSETPRLDAELLLGFAVGVGPDRDRGASRRAGRRRCSRRDIAPCHRPAGGRRAGGLHPRDQGVPRPRLRRRRPRPDPAPGDGGARRARPGRGHAPAHGSARPAGAPPIRVADVGTGSGAVAIALVVSLRRRRAHEEVGSWPRTSRPMRWTSPARTPSGTPWPTRSGSCEADLLPPVVADPFDAGPREPAVRPERCDGRAADRDLVRAGARARRRAGRARGHRPAARAAAGRAGGRRARAPRDRGDQGEAIVDLVASVLPGWACTVQPDLAGLPAWRDRRRARASPPGGIGEGPSSSGRA